MTNVAPRLLDREQVAMYLGVSKDTVDRLRHAGTLPTVSIPGSRDRRTNRASSETCRRILVDRHDCDRLIENWKEGELA